jgi:hypothetical protein
VKCEQNIDVQRMLCYISEYFYMDCIVVFSNIGPIETFYGHYGYFIVSDFLPEIPPSSGLYFSFFI